MVLCLVAVLIALDVLVRAGRRSRGSRPSRAAIARVWRERWTLAAGIAVGSALISFYVTYLSYRNLKSVVPLLRPGELFDQRAGRSRSQPVRRARSRRRCCMTLLGTGVQTHLLSGAYMLFFAFIPGTLAFALVFSRNLAVRPLLRDRAVDQLAAGRRRATSSCRHWGPSTPSRPSSRICPSRPSPGCRISCSTSGSSSFATRRPARRRASRPSPRCTCPSSSPRRWHRICSDSPGRCASGRGSCSA